MTQPAYDQAYSYIAALAGDPETTIVDFRAIHDQRQDVAAIPIRETLPKAWASLLHYQEQGYGIFVTINQIGDVLKPGTNRIAYDMTNVAYCRAHVVDLDNASAQQNYERAIVAEPKPNFAVQTSPGKFHIYWLVQPYTGNDYYSLQQRKIRQLYDGDRNVIDASRVLRLPGSLHLKGTPTLVQMWALDGWAERPHVSVIEQAYQHINVIDNIATRKPLGEPDLAAPSKEWIQYALDTTDPNDLSRGEWIAHIAAVKQAGWSLMSEEELYDMISNWCERYGDNDHAENAKQWMSIRDTELGWNSLVSRNPALKGQKLFGSQQLDKGGHVEPAGGIVCVRGDDSQPVANAKAEMPAPPSLDCSGPMLTSQEQQVWFDGCTYITTMDRIMTPDIRFLKSSQFNAVYGGKDFILDQNGKTTDEAYKAATRSRDWQIPKVDHTRFLPEKEFREIVIDPLGRDGINVYRPHILKSAPGDIQPFLNHLNILIPDPIDQAELMAYFAHISKYPGFKVPWAPLIQSVQGIGKGIFKKILGYTIGSPYCHFPSAMELAKSGAQFNGWMRHKLFLLVDEVKVTHERRDLIEILKPMISEELIEVQSKGIDQVMEDNPANWTFFSNYKDAIPFSQNERRWAVFYLSCQTKADLAAAGLNGAYFKYMHDWLDNQGGLEAMAHYLMNYPIERGQIAMSAPPTTSEAEAKRVALSPLEQTISEAVKDGLPGFIGGWVSVIAAQNRIREADHRRPSPNAVARILEGLGYTHIGRADRPYYSESERNRTDLFNLNPSANINDFASLQGYA